MTPSATEQAQTRTRLLIIDPTYLACPGLLFTFRADKHVHNFERWASLPVLIIFIIMLGEVRTP